MTAGDTFFIQDRSVDDHLWVVISNPQVDPDRVVMVSITTYATHKENVCLLEIGEHPRITHKSCIYYEGTRSTTLEKLCTLRDEGLLNVQAPVTGKVLKRMRDGVSKSTRIMSKYIDILLEQEVIE